MKKKSLILLTIVPIILNYVIGYSFVILRPSLGNLVYYFAPWLLLIFWFYAGKKYAEAEWKFIKSLFISHSIGILSLMLYLYQTYLLNDNTRNFFILGFSRAFTSLTYLFTARIAILFEAEKNIMTQTSTTAMQILGLILMATVFTCGYLSNTRKEKQIDNYYINKFEQDNLK